MFGFNKKEKKNQPVVVANINEDIIDESSLNKSKSNVNKQEEVLEELEEKVRKIRMEREREEQEKIERGKIKEAILKQDNDDVYTSTPQIIIKPQVVSIEQMMNILFERQEQIIEKIDVTYQRQEVLDSSMRKLVEYIKR